ncbi:MAG TPA: hypothetical protein DDZ19_04860 [Flavobacteriales bacterium]|jgi:hypothetical protein|nr:hypothetical protein [Flavobacteriales bacterium]
MKHILLLLGTALPLLLVHAQTPGNIEAAEYDPSENRWFISNNTSILSTADGGLSYDYFGNATASHGMEVMDGHLYAIGNNVVRAYDLTTAALVGSTNISGAVFLNGMGSRSGELIVSDFSTGKLHRIDISDPANMVSEVLVSSTGTTPNGVVIDDENNRALVVNWGNNASIISVDLETAALSEIVPNTGMGNLDGIDMDGEGRFYVSSWSPARITRYSNDFSTSEIVVQGAGSGLSNPADISYAIATDTLGVANSGSGTPSFHAFGAISAITEPLEITESVQWTANALRVESPIAGTWTLRVYNPVGQLMHESNMDLPNAPVHIATDRLGFVIAANQIWQVQSPSGRSFAIRPGQRPQ